MVTCFVCTGIVGVGYVSVTQEFRENTKKVDANFDSYVKSVNDIADHFVEEPEIDKSSYERYAKKGRDLLDINKKALENLEKSLADTDKYSSYTFLNQEYKNAVNSYITESKKIVDLENDNVSSSDKSMNAMFDLIDVENDFQVIANFLYSDPGKYASDLQTKLIPRLTKSITEMEKVKVQDSDYQKMMNINIQIMKVMRKFFQDTASAAEDKDNTKLQNARSQYLKDLNRLQEELNTLSDDIKERVKTIRDTLSDLEKKQIESLITHLSNKQKIKQKSRILCGIFACPITNQFLQLYIY